MSSPPAVLMQAEPRFRHAPPAVESDAQRAIDLAAVAGISLDDWQIDVLTDALGIRPDGRWASNEIGLIVPRQNGKNYVLLVAELYWLFLCPDRRITHSAHVFKTAKDHFRELRMIIEDCPSLLKRVKPNGFRIGNDDLSIELKDGSRLAFMSRAKGSGRGLSGDKVVLDEALWLWDEAIASVLPTLSARPNPQVWYTSSSPIPGEQSDFLRRLCRRGRLGDPGGRMAYTEFSAPDDANLDDPAVWGEANPSLGGWLDIEAVELERRSMTDEAFRQERLGMWDEDEDASTAIDAAKWNTHALDTAGPDWLADPVVFGIEGNPSGDCFTVVAAGHTPTDRIGLDVVAHDHGTGWLLDWAIQANETHAPKAWVFDPKSSTADLFMADFRAAGLTVIECGFPDRALPRATAGLHDDICNGRIEHLNHPALDAAAGGATWRFVGESRLWDRKAGVMIAPLVAATLARFGLLEESAPAPVPFLIRR